MTENTYDRTTQDVGNILGMEHVNVTIPNQEIATTFYVAGLGFTRDPYMMVGPENMWVNVGQQQFHLPTREPQVLRGHVGLVVPDLEALKARLGAVQERLAGTKFTCSAENGYVAVTCPWGNHYRCYAPDPQRFGNMVVGIPYVEFAVKPGTAAGIGQFYKEVMHAPYTLSQDINNGAVVQVSAGNQQCLIFRETSGDLPEYDGHHIAVYVANFSGPHAFLKQHGLITQESDAHQYRFQDIVHPETGRQLFTIEHEVRSLYHPMYGREFVNRNASQNIRAYARGRDALVPVG
jgi:catechol 2,3-dioxygenase-like lactoylglutathione lyase family enzyme